MGGTLYRCEEWSAYGRYYCEHTGKHNWSTDLWVVPARILGMSADEFLRFLIKEFKPDHIFGRPDGSFVGWCWYTQAGMRKYKNFINAEARKKNFLVQRDKIACEVFYIEYKPKV